MASSETPPAQAFAKTHGSPGLRVRWIGMLRLFWPLALGLFVAGYLVRCGIPHPALPPVAAGLGLLALAALLLGVQGRALERFGAFLKGARGEEMVARELALLPGSFEVFHGLPDPSGGGDLDHVVVGPGGVAVLETKHWSGPVTYQSGEVFARGLRPTRSPIAQVRRAAAQLRAALAARGADPGDVLPVLCLAGNPFEQEILSADGLHICNSRSACAVLLRLLGRPAARPGLPREAIGAALRTWSGE